MKRDPYSNAQMQFERTDQTGRWIPLIEDDPLWPLYAYTLGVAAFIVTVSLLLVHLA